MLTLLYDFYYGIFSNLNSEGYPQLQEIQFLIGGFNCSLEDYLCLMCSIISLIFIVVLCCLFIYKIIKLVGGLIR